MIDRAGLVLLGPRNLLGKRRRGLVAPGGADEVASLSQAFAKLLEELAQERDTGPGHIRC